MDAHLRIPVTFLPNRHALERPSFRQLTVGMSSTTGGRDDYADSLGCASRAGDRSLCPSCRDHVRARAAARISSDSFRERKSSSVIR